MEQKRNDMQKKYFDYVEFAINYNKLKAADRRILSAHLQQLKSNWFEAFVKYKKRVNEEGRGWGYFVSLDRLHDKVRTF